MSSHQFPIVRRSEGSATVLDRAALAALYRESEGVPAAAQGLCLGLRGSDRSTEPVRVQQAPATAASAVMLLALGISPEHAKAEEVTPLKFQTLEGGIKALDIRLGKGAGPSAGDAVSVQYIGRLFAKQGWQFDNTYKNLDKDGFPIAYTFVYGSGDTIKGIEVALQNMQEGGVRRVVIPPPLGFTDMKVGPVPKEFSNRQRLYTTIFNPTRLANGEGDTLGTLMFDIELVKVKREAA
eukprot:gene7675-833_t